MNAKFNVKWKYICLILIFLLIVLLLISALASKQKSMNYWSYNIGNTVLFGKFEQDNNVQNGKENIEWIIIDESDGKVLLLSKNCLYARTSKNNKSGWKASALREWLNNSFYKKTFDNYEKNSIINTSSICYAKELHDRVFILSSEELEKYAHIYHVQETIPTQYVLNNFKDNLNFAAENCETWLRNDNDFGYVEDFDEIYYGGYTCGTSSGEVAGVRPAIWVNAKRLN